MKPKVFLSNAAICERPFGRRKRTDWKHVSLSSTQHRYSVKMPPPSVAAHFIVDRWLHREREIFFALTVECWLKNLTAVCEDACTYSLFVWIETSGILCEIVVVTECVDAEVILCIDVSLLTWPAHGRCIVSVQNWVALGYRNC